VLGKMCREEGVVHEDLYLSPLGLYRKGWQVLLYSLENDEASVSIPRVIRNRHDPQRTDRIGGTVDNTVLPPISRRILVHWKMRSRFATHHHGQDMLLEHSFRTAKNNDEIFASHQNISLWGISSTFQTSSRSLFPS
jgi:hypothetical protein